MEPPSPVVAGSASFSAPVEQEAALSATLIDRVCSVVSSILSSLAGYLWPNGNVREDHRVLVNVSGPPGVGGRFVFAVREADSNRYPDIVSHSKEVPHLRGSLLRNQPVFALQIPHLCDTDASIVPETPHAPLINWFLNKKNIHQIQETVSEADSLTQFLKRQFLKDFLRPGAVGAKIYEIQEKSKDGYTIAHSLNRLATDEAQVEQILNELFGAEFVRSRPDDLLVILALMCQNAGITAHGIIETHERLLHSQLDTICLCLDKQTDRFKITLKGDGSITFLYTFTAPYKFIDVDETQQLKDAQLVFSVNLNRADESPPQLFYSYEVVNSN